MQATATSTYKRIRRVAIWLVERFYRVQLPEGHVPDEGPLLLVSNHSNGLVDAALQAASTPRQLHYIAKYKLFSMPFLGWLARGTEAIPVYRKKDGVSREGNLQSFEAVFEALREGRAIAVFPEGTSHSEPSVREFKTGTARMALGAEATCDFELGVGILPVGLVYEARDTPRSRIWIRVGEPVFATDLREHHERDEWGAVQELTSRVDRAVRRVTLNLEREADRPVLELAESLLPKGAESRPARLADLVLGLSWYRQHRPDEVEPLVRRLAAFHRRLAVLGLSAELLDSGRGVGALALFCLRSIVLAALAAPLALLAVLTWCLPWFLARGACRLLPLPGDKWVTTLILACLVTFPGWLVVLTVVAGVRAGPTAAALTPFAAILLLFIGTALWDRRGLWLGDVAVALNLRPDRRLRERLTGERDGLTRDLRALERLARTRAARGALDARGPRSEFAG